jgi:hypothetical protein
MLLERGSSQRLGKVITALDALTIGLFCAISTTKSLTLGALAIPRSSSGALRRSAAAASILRPAAQPIARMRRIAVCHRRRRRRPVPRGPCLAQCSRVYRAAVVCVAVTFGVRVLAVLFW